MSSAISILLTLGAAASFRPDAQQLFSGCGSERDGPAGRYYACKGWSVSLVAFRTFKPSREQAFVVIHSVIRVALKGELREEEVKRTLAGREVDALRFFPVDAAKPEIGFAEGTMILHGPGSRLIMFVAQTDTEAQRERCTKVLDYIAVNGAPDGVDLEAVPAIGEPAILSRKLQVPAGCKLATANDLTGRIQCESSMLSWTIMPEAQPIVSLSRWLDEMIPIVTSGEGGYAEERIPCQVEGTGTTCARLTKAVPRGTLRMYIGPTTIDGRPVLISCAFLDSGAGLPPVCNNTIGAPLS